MGRRTTEAVAGEGGVVVIPSREVILGIRQPVGQTNSNLLCRGALLRLCELHNPMDLSGFGGNSWIDLEDVESTVGTAFSDVIIGADAVYTIEYPEPEADVPAPALLRLIATNDNVLTVKRRAV